MVRAIAGSEIVMTPEPEHEHGSAFLRKVAIDRWGPGTRVPTLIVGPFAKRHFVDHSQYETVSILALIEKRFHLKPLGTRDARANPFTNALNVTQ